MPYHDTNDFYYSGHVGTTTIYMLEFYYNDQKFMFCVALFVLVNQWILLMLVRTHYIIDLVSGFIIACWALMNSEWITYILDVKLVGWSADKRKPYAYNICTKCGWSNYRLEGCVSTHEKTFLKKIFNIKNQMKAR